MTHFCDEPYVTLACSAATADFPRACSHEHLDSGSGLRVGIPGTRREAAHVCAATILLLELFELILVEQSQKSTKNNIH